MEVSRGILSTLPAYQGHTTPLTRTLIFILSARGGAGSLPFIYLREL